VPNATLSAEATSGAGPSRSRWVRFLEGSVGWVLAGAVVGEETAAARAAQVDMAFGREVEVAYPCVRGLGSGITAGFMALLVVVVVDARPRRSVLVSEMPLGGTTVVSVLFFFLLRLFRECVVGLPEPWGAWVVLGGGGCWIGLRERVSKPHTLCWLAWVLPLRLTGGVWVATAEEDELDDDDDDDEEDEEEVLDSSSELEESILMGVFNDGRIVGDFRTTRPGIDIGCDRFHFLLTQDRPFQKCSSYQ